MLLKFISARLRELRKKHRLTQEQLAVLLGADIKWYQRVEWGEKDVRASTIDRLATAFGVTAVEFLSTPLPETKVRAMPSAPHRPKKSAAKKSAKR